MRQIAATLEGCQRSPTTSTHSSAAERTQAKPFRTPGVVPGRATILPDHRIKYGRFEIPDTGGSNPNILRLLSAFMITAFKAPDALPTEPHAGYG